MDDASYKLDELSLAVLAELGLKSDLTGKYRWSYVGIAAKGVAGFESVEKLTRELIEITLLKNDTLGLFALPFDLNVISAGLPICNTSSIIINQKEYYLKKRGMNIVVYDISMDEVVSSVNFDTHATNFN